ncbi:MAG: MgtC/SapB family protein [Pseudomonadota bacterium]
MNPLQDAQTFLISLAVGLMMGLERQRRVDARAGLRSFALVAVLGTVTALLAERFNSPWPLIAGLVLVGAVMLQAVRPSAASDDADTVTPLAALLCFCLGALFWFQQFLLGVAIAFAATSLLYFKAELHGLSERLTRRDLLSLLQFVLISCIVLPLLPNQGYGPYAALNPYRLWLMVVLTSGLGLAAYVALRLLGHRRGAPLVGVLGGAVSSTVTTLVYSRHLRSASAPLAVALAVILIANLTVLVRLVALTAVMGRGVLPELLPILALAFMAGAAMAWHAWRGIGSAPTVEPLEVSNPIELKTALGFALMFGIVLIAAAWLNERAGASGVYLVALVSGLTDVDVITLSALQMHEQGQLQAAEAARAISIACAANLVSKACIVAAVAGRALLWPVLRGFLATALGLALGCWWMS